MKKIFPLLIILLTFTGALSAQIFLDLYKNRQDLPDDVKKQTQQVQDSYDHAVLKNYNNKEINLKKIKSDIVIINFWASWCEACLEEMPSLVSLKKKYGEEKIKILAINQDSSPDYRQKINKIIKKYNLNFDIVPDARGKWSDAFLVKNVPTTFLFYKGKLIDIKTGLFDFNDESFLKKMNSLGDKN